MDKTKLWVATVLIEAIGRYGLTNNEQRKENLLKIIKETASRTQGNGIILLPGGYFNTGRNKPLPQKYGSWTKPIKKTLAKIKNRRIIVCVGIDGRYDSSDPLNIPKDQIVLAVDKTGIITIARKFHPSSPEKNNIPLAKNYLAKEQNKPRIFELNGKRFYLAVCYDIFGIKHRNLKNPKVDGVLNSIHRFTERCQCETDDCMCGAVSGDVYFVKNGMAGASRLWGVVVYGSTVFFNRDVPERWPSGVLYNGNGKSPRHWRYNDNKMKSKKSYRIEFKEEKSIVSLFGQ